MTTQIVDYSGGNLSSLRTALLRLGAESENCSDPLKLRGASRVILPGVGHAGSAVQSLQASGLWSEILSLRCPVLGICLGFHLLCASSEEGGVIGLGVYPVEVRRFTKARKIPHIGWNSLCKPTGRLFEGVSDGEAVYFVHSYFAPPGNLDCALATHEEEFSAAVERENFYAVQFHPEKSGNVGEKILRNFLEV